MARPCVRQEFRKQTMDSFNISSQMRCPPGVSGTYAKRPPGFIYLFPGRDNRILAHLSASMEQQACGLRNGLDEFGGRPSPRAAGPLGAAPPKEVSRSSAPL